MEEWEELNIEEKIRLLKGLIKNLQYTKYNIQQELSAELALDEPNQNSIDIYSKQMVNLLDKESYFKNELNLLQVIE